MEEKIERETISLSRVLGNGYEEKPVNGDVLKVDAGWRFTGAHQGGATRAEEVAKKEST